MRLKSLLLLAALCLGPLTPRSVRADDEVSFDYFYTALQEQGDWFGTDTYGYVFQPRAAAKDPNWRPYADGYWSYTDEGWTWISYEDFGWATYHYGRWAKLASIGWVWVPGYEWAPAWVSWRTSSGYSDDLADEADQTIDPNADFIGWAPLPPNAVLYPGVGIVGGIDYLYDIPPENYCFVPTPFFCAPALIVVIFVPTRNYFCIGHTINVTNCHIRDHRGVPRIICGGPNFERLQHRVPRPIPRFTIERRAGVPPPGRGSPALLNQVRGKTLDVIAPRIAPPPGVATSAVGLPRNASTQRPAQVKAMIAKAEPQAGWNTPGVQPQAVQAARDQLKRESARTSRQAVAANPTRPVSSDPPGPPAGATRPNPNVAMPNPAAGESPQDTFRRQQAEERERRQQVLAEQQRRAEEAGPQNDSPEAQVAQRQQQLEAQQRSQSEAQARMQAMRQQQVEQARQAQANAQAQRQQQLEAHRQAQADRQRRAQAEIQARAEAQRDATRQAQQQAEQQRRAVEAQRRMDAARDGAKGTQTP